MRGALFFHSPEPSLGSVEPTDAFLARLPSVGTHLSASSSLSTPVPTPLPAVQSEMHETLMECGLFSHPPIRGGARLSLHNEPQSAHCGLERQTRVINPSRFPKSLEAQDLRVTVETPEDSKSDGPEFKSSSTIHRPVSLDRLPAPCRVHSGMERTPTPRLSGQSAACTLHPLIKPTP